MINFVLPYNKDFIKSIIVYENYFASVRIEKFLPNQNVALVFHSGDIPEYSLDNCLNFKELPQIYFTFPYLAAKPIHFKFKEHIKTIILVLNPLAILPLSDFTTNLFQNSLFIDAKELLRDNYHVLFHVYNSGNSLSDKIRKITYFFRNIAAKSFSYKQEKLQFALEIIYLHKGCLSINQLAKDCFVSKRTLERYFKQYLATTADQYSQIVRFNATIQALKQNVKTKDVIEMFRFNDYSHLIKEFKQFCSETPNSFLKGFLADRYSIEKILEVF